jgi:hypothetical protein
VQDKPGWPITVVCAWHGWKAGSVFVAGKLIFATGAKKSEGMLFGSSFQFDCAGAVSFIPKNRDLRCPSARWI